LIRSITGLPFTHSVIGTALRLQDATATSSDSVKTDLMTFLFIARPVPVSNPAEVRTQSPPEGKAKSQRRLVSLHC
jgi:hypothetical protein